MTYTFEKQLVDDNTGYWTADMARNAHYIYASGDEYMWRGDPSGNYEQIPYGENGLNNWIIYWGVSGNGEYVVGVPYNKNYIYLSDDYGQTWSQKTVLSSFYKTFAQVLISKTGQYMMMHYRTGAFPGNEICVVVSRDYGETWNQIPTTNFLDSMQIGMSHETGQVMAICGVDNNPLHYGLLYISTDYGQTWNERHAGTYENSAVCINKDGTKIYSLHYYNELYVSNNYGVSWSLVWTDPDEWYGLYLDCDGSGEVVMLVEGGYDGTPDVWISENYGVSFTSYGSDGQGYDAWAVSEDGSRILYAGDWLWLAGGATGLIKAVSSQDFPTGTKAVTTILKANIKAISSQSNS